LGKIEIEREENPFYCLAPGPIVGIKFTASKSFLEALKMRKSEDFFSVKITEVPERPFRPAQTRTELDDSTGADDSEVEPSKKSPLLSALSAVKSKGQLAGHIRPETSVKVA
jgi:hypothetical protein